MFRCVQQFIIDDSGATLIEYALIAGLVSLGAIGGITALGTGNSGSFHRVFIQTIIPALSGTPAPAS